MASYADCRGQVGRAEESDDEKTVNGSEGEKKKGNLKLETKIGTKSDFIGF